MYSFEKMPHLGPEAGIGMGPDSQPYKFDSEEESANWYFAKLNAWLVWA